MNKQEFYPGKVFKRSMEHGDQKPKKKNFFSAKFQNGSMGEKITFCIHDFSLSQYTSKVKEEKRASKWKPETSTSESASIETSEQ